MVRAATSAFSTASSVASATPRNRPVILVSGSMPSGTTGAGGGPWSPGMPSLPVAKARKKSPL